MRVLVFGASGMVGRGVLRECFAAGDVERVQSVGRTPLPVHAAKHVDLVVPRWPDLADVEAQLVRFDACFFCLGVSSAGMNEADYARITFDLTLSIAQVLARLNPGMTFVYVSGAGTDSSEAGRSMWARVKGRTENALLRLPLKAVYLFRPGMIVPLHGVRSKTRSYRILYAALRPALGVLRRVFPRSVATTQSVGRAMLAVARHGAATPHVGPAEIEELGGRGA